MKFQGIHARFLGKKCDYEKYYFSLTYTRRYHHKTTLQIEDRDLKNLSLQIKFLTTTLRLSNFPVNGLWGASFCHRWFVPLRVAKSGRVEWGSFTSVNGHISIKCVYASQSCNKQTEKTHSEKYTLLFYFERSTLTIDTHLQLQKVSK